jgi:hypothetical protein
MTGAYIGRATIHHGTEPRVRARIPAPQPVVSACVVVAQPPGRDCGMAVKQIRAFRSHFR